jgi:hypothetical protein
MLKKSLSGTKAIIYLFLFKSCCLMYNNRNPQVWSNMPDNCFLSLNQVIPMALNSWPHVKSALLIKRGGGPGGKVTYRVSGLNNFKQINYFLVAPLLLHFNSI